MENLICNYSDLPSPWAYVLEDLRAGLTSRADIDRVIEMAWEDRTPFEAIEAQFGLNESAVRVLMKRELRWSSYKRWRERVELCQTKHLGKRPKGMMRFRSSRQRAISMNRISKR